MEEKRWAVEVKLYEDLIAQIKLELDSLNECINLFSSDEMASIGDSMLDRLNQL